MSKKIYKFGVFRVSRKPSQYKTTEGFLRRVYKENKEKIDLALSGTNIKPENYKKAFVQSVKDELEYGNRMIHLDTGRVRYKKHTTRSALRAVGRSEVYLEPSERFRENALKGIKSEGRWKAFRENALRDPKTGRYRAFNPNKMNYQGKGIYIYDGRIRIDFQNSPKGKKGQKLRFTHVG